MFDRVLTANSHARLGFLSSMSISLQKEAGMEKNRLVEGHPRERGQALIVAVLAFGVLIGMVAMTIDVGMLFHGRRQSQNSADAMALAGVAELPANPDLAIQRARDWGAHNGVLSSEIKKIEVRTTSYPNDTLYVQLEGEFN